MWWPGTPNRWPRTPTPLPVSPCCRAAPAPTSRAGRRTAARRTARERSRRTAWNRCGSRARFLFRGTPRGGTRGAGRSGITAPGLDRVGVRGRVPLRGHPGGGDRGWGRERDGGVRLLAGVGADSADWHRGALLAAGVRRVLGVDGERPTAVVIALVD